MTYFRIDGECLTKACNRNRRIMLEAERIYFANGSEAAKKFVKEHTKNEFKTKKLHTKIEDLKGRRKALGVSATFMAKVMNYSRSHYITVEEGKCKYSESFYDSFVKAEKKLSKLFKRKKV